MAILIPDARKEQIVFSHQSEQDLYEAISCRLGDDWLVVYGRRLEDESGVSREADFILIKRDVGILIIEQKSGKVRRKDGKWVYANGNPMKDPIDDQAMPFAHLLHKMMKNDFKQDVAFAYAACLEGLRSKDLDRLYRHESRSLYLTRDDIDSGLVGKIEKLMSQIRPRRFDFDTVVKAFRGSSFKADIRLRDYIDHQERKKHNSQAIVATNALSLLQNKFTLVTGGAGTGKSWIAIELIKKYCAKNPDHKVLFLTFNVLINRMVRQQVEGQNQVVVQTFEDFYVAQGHEGAPFDAEFLSTLIGNLRVPDEYNMVVIDECQDIPQDIVLDAFIEPREKQGYRLICLMDQSQSIFEHALASKDDIEANFMDAYHYRLRLNYRNTEPIAKMAMLMYPGGNLDVLHYNRRGSTPEVVKTGGHSDFKKVLTRLLKDLIVHQSVRPEEIMILSPLRIDNNKSNFQTYGTKFGQFEVWCLKEGHSGSNSIGHTTFKACKGIERPVVIICDLDMTKLDFDKDGPAKDLFVAMTRAEHCLYFIGDESSPETQKLDSAWKQVDADNFGVLTIEKLSEARVGNLISLNSRFGKVKIDSEEGETQVVVFPQDLPKKCQPGDTVSCEIRVEDGISFAQNLNKVSGA